MKIFYNEEKARLFFFGSLTLKEQESVCLKFEPTTHVNSILDNLLYCASFIAVCVLKNQDSDKISIRFIEY